MAELTYEEKLELYHQEFAARGVRENLKTPLVFRFLWNLGVRIPPPLFFDTKSLFLIYGLLCGSGISFLSLLVNCVLLPMLQIFGPPQIDDGIPNLKILTDFALSFLIGGIPLGGLIAYEFRRLTQKHNLPAWREYGKAEYHIASLNNTEDTDVKVLAAGALGKIGNKSAAESLMDAMKNPNRILRSIAAKALGEIGDTRATASLVTALNDADETVREEAAKSLGRMANEKAVGPLIRAMNDSGTVRAAAAEALGIIGDKRAVPVLINALKDADEFVRSAAAEALGLLGDDQVTDALISTLKDENEYVRGTAAKALGQIGTKQIIAPLLSASVDTHEFVRASVAEALGILRSPRFVDNLIVALDDVNDYVRCAAAEALGRVGDMRAIGPLINAAKDRGSNWDTDKAAARSLAKLAESCRPFLQDYPDLFCSECFRRAIQKDIRPVGVYVEKATCVFCPECHVTNNLLIGVKTVIGVIGGELKMLTKTDIVVEVPLWNEKTRKARFADIDFLHIRKGGVEEYHLAINAVILELSADKSRPGDWLKNVPVDIGAGTNLAAGTVGMLRDNFKL